MNTITIANTGTLKRVQCVLFIARCEERLARIGRADMSTAVALAAIAGAARGWAQACPRDRPVFERCFLGLASRAKNLAEEQAGLISMIVVAIHSAIIQREAVGFERLATLAGGAMISAYGLSQVAIAREKMWQDDMLVAMVKCDRAGVGRLMNGRVEPRRKKLSMSSAGAKAIGSIDNQRVSAPQFGVQNSWCAQRVA